MPAPNIHGGLASDAYDPMKRKAQTGSNTWLKSHGTQVWKPALQGFAMVLPVHYEISGLVAGEKWKSLAPGLRTSGVWATERKRRKRSWRAKRLRGPAVYFIIQPRSESQDELVSCLQF
jgi:hypothetical protein